MGLPPTRLVDLTSPPLPRRRAWGRPWGAGPFGVDDSVVGSSYFVGWGVTRRYGLSAL